MGPKLFSFTKGETTYSFRLLPIGGYCAMEGEDEDSENPRAFNNVKIWKRMIIIVAGAFMNIVFGVALMLITLLPNEQFVSTTVSEFEPYSFSAMSGLKEGDEIVEINGYKVRSTMDLSFALYTMPLRNVDGTTLEVYKQDCFFTLFNSYSNSVNKAKLKDTSTINSLLIEGSEKICAANDKDSAYKELCTYIDKGLEACKLENTHDYPQVRVKETTKRFCSDVVVVRDGEEITLKDVMFFTDYISNPDAPTIGFDMYFKPIEKTFGSVISQTFIQSGSVVRTVWNSLLGMFTGQFGLNDMAGPVGLAGAITEVAGESLKISFSHAVMSILNIMVIISINLGIVNMLPFPALDGGRFVMLLIEAIFKKPVPRKVEAIINAVGLGILLTFMLFVTCNDIFKLFGG